MHYFISVAALYSHDGRAHAGAFVCESVGPKQGFKLEETLALYIGHNDKMEGQALMWLVALQKIREKVMPGDLIFADLPLDYTPNAHAPYLSSVMKQIEEEVHNIALFGGRVFVAAGRAQDSQMQYATDLCQRALTNPSMDRARYITHLLA